MSVVMKKSPMLFRKFVDLRKSHENISEMEQPESSDPPPDEDRQSLADSVSIASRDSVQGGLSVSSDPHTQNSFKDPASYHWRQTFADLKDIGQLKVHLVSARGLYGADFGGKSDPFAVLQLRDLEYKSNTVAKNLNPEWREEFLFDVADISEVLYVTVWDKDRFHDPEFLGRVAVPVNRLRQEDNGKDVVLALKDKNFARRAKGTHPQIVLRFHLSLNRARAAIRSVQKPEPPKQAAFKKSLFINNVQRVRKVLHFVGSVNGYLQSCFSWEDPKRSAKAFVGFETLAYFFEPYMLPLAMLVFIFAYPLFATDLISDWLDPYSDLEHNDEDDDDDEKEDEKSDKKTISERYKAIQEVTAFVQNTLGLLASTAERVKNVFNFSSPFMSWLAIAAMSLATLVLYWLPLRVMVMLWGVNKFSKKILRPNHQPSSELLNFLSRVPDDPTISKCKILSLMDQQLLKEEEEEKAKKEKKTTGKIAKRVSSFFHKDKGDFQKEKMMQEMSKKEEESEEQEFFDEIDGAVGGAEETTEKVIEKRTIVDRYRAIQEGWTWRKERKKGKKSKSKEKSELEEEQSEESD